jgi:hypothetical protein
MRPRRSRAKAFPSREIGIPQIEGNYHPRDIFWELRGQRDGRHLAGEGQWAAPKGRAIFSKAIPAEEIPALLELPPHVTGGCLSAPGGIAGSGVSEWNKIRNISFHGGADSMEVEMRKFLAVMTAAVVIAGFTIDSASARHHHRHGGPGHGFSMRGLGGSNAELRGNNSNSASGSNSLANPNNTSGPH